jgi:hypothetical protein
MEADRSQVGLFARGAYVAHTEGNVMVWDVKSLWERSVGLPAKQVPLDSFANFDKPCWLHPMQATVRNIAKHAKRIYDTDLNYPVILSSRGELMDGMHRIAKAWIMGFKEIAAVQFEMDPDPDRIWPMPEDGNVSRLITEERERLAVAQIDNEVANQALVDTARKLADPQPDVRQEKMEQNRIEKRL